MATKFLVIQTAFIGDVVLATPLVEKLHRFFPEAEIDFLVRKGNEGLFTGHPFLHEVLIWNKKKKKFKNLWKTLKKIRAARYDKVINLQRFAATGILTAFSGAGERIGFDRNPLSFLFDTKVAHVTRAGMHEIERNLKLISRFTDSGLADPPRLYPSPEDYLSVSPYTQHRYICIAPSSVWFTKQYPAERWISFLDALKGDFRVYLLGAPSDEAACEHIRNATKLPGVISLAGKLTFLESAALMKDAEMNYVNDSAPLHFASAMDAPVAAVFCSTVPAFGYGPLSRRSFIVETPKELTCRPCGLHGKKACPLGHFDCAYSISTGQLLSVLP